jgi:hypothetical protein
VAKAVDMFLSTAVLLMATILLFSLLLYVFRLLWGLCLTTPVGMKYVELNGDMARILSEMVNSPVFWLAFQITWSSFITCLLIGVASQFFYITRYFYMPRYALGKVFFFGLPLATLVAWDIEAQFELSSTEMAYGFALGPTLCVFSACFEYTSQLIPEVGDVITTVRTWFARLSIAFPVYREKIRVLMKKIGLIH